jgi:hypothetical protein
MCGYGTGQKLSISLGQYTTVFWTEMYAVEASVVENLDRKKNLKVGCLHPVACTRSGSGFPSIAALV